MPGSVGTVLGWRPQREPRLLGGELAQKEVMLTLKPAGLCAVSTSQQGVDVLGSRGAQT